MGGDAFGSALLRVAPGPQGHAQARIQHLVPPLTPREQ